MIRKINKKCTIPTNQAVYIILGLVIIALLAYGAYRYIGGGLNKTLDLFGENEVTCEKTGMSLREYRSGYEEELQHSADNIKAAETAKYFKECFPDEFDDLDFPKGSVTRFNHARVLERLGYTFEARGIYQDFSKTNNPLKDDAIYRVGQTYITDGNYQDAQTIYENYLNTPAAKLEDFSQLQLANIYLNNNNKKGAIAQYENFYSRHSDPQTFIQLTENPQGQGKKIFDYLNGLNNLKQLYLEKQRYVELIGIYDLEIYTKFIMRNPAGMKKSYDTAMQAFDNANIPEQDKNKYKAELTIRSLKRYGKYAGRDLKCEKTAETSMQWDEEWLYIDKPTEFSESLNVLDLINEWWNDVGEVELPQREQQFKSFVRNDLCNDYKNQNKVV